MRYRLPSYYPEVPEINLYFQKIIIQILRLIFEQIHSASSQKWVVYFLHGTLQGAIIHLQPAQARIVNF